MEISNSFMTKLNELCVTCANPERAKSVMKRIMKAAIHLEKARYVVNLFLQLKKKKIGTTEIESLSKRMCQRLPERRQRTLVNTIVQWKIEDARSMLNRARHENTKLWRDCKQLLIDLNIIDQFTIAWSHEKGRLYGLIINENRK